MKYINKNEAESEGLKVRDRDSEYLKPAFMEAAKQMADLIKNGVSKNDKDQIRLSISVLGAYSRLKAVENNESVIGLNIARSMAGDTEELKDIIRKTLPEYVVR